MKGSGSMKRSGVTRAIVVAFTLFAVMSSVMTVNAQQAPPDGECLPGFVPRPPELNPALGRCVPSAIAANIAVFDNDPGTCLPGFVQRPVELNPALGPCVPGSLAANTAVFANDPGTCLPGFVPRPPELNPALGPCVPGSLATDTFLVPILDVDPGTCPPGWVRAAPPLNPQLGCIPGEIGIPESGR